MYKNSANDKSRVPGELLWRTLLHGDFLSAGQGQVERGAGSCHEERDFVKFGCNSQLIAANLIRRVAICCNAIRSNDLQEKQTSRFQKTLLFSIVVFCCAFYHNVHAFERDEGTGHGVADKSARQLVLHDLKGCQSGALIVRPRFQSIDVL